MTDTITIDTPGIEDGVYVVRLEFDSRVIRVDVQDSIRQAVLREREACAKLVEEHLSGVAGIRDAETYDRDSMLEDLAAAIRARGVKQA